MKNKTKTLTQGQPLKLILLFAIPIFLGSLFQILYGLVDTKIVGSILGETALAAVGSVSNLYNLVLGFFNGLSLGFSVIIARHYGSGDVNALKKSVAASLLLGFLTAAVVVTVTALTLPEILELLYVPKEQYAMSYSYIRILTWGIFISLAYNLCANMLRAIGDSVTPLLFLIFAALVNVVLDYAFILQFDMGVAGAAWATVISQFLSVALCMLRIYRSFPILHVRASDFRLTKEQIGVMCQSGLSMGLMSSLVNFGTVALQSGINQLGTSIIVAHTAARKVFEIWTLPAGVLGSAMATYCSQNYGAGEYGRIRQGMKGVLILGMLWAAAVFCMAQTISPYLIRFIASTQQEEIIAWGTRYLKVDMCFMAVCVLIVLLRNSMQGFGDFITPVISSGVELVGKLVFAFVFVKRFGYWGIIWTEPVVWILMVIPLIVMTLRNPVIRTKGV